MDNLTPFADTESFDDVLDSVNALIAASGPKNALGSKEEDVEGGEATNDAEDAIFGWNTGEDTLKTDKMTDQLSSALFGEGGSGASPTLLSKVEASSPPLNSDIWEEENPDSSSFLKDDSYNDFTANVDTMLHDLKVLSTSSTSYEPALVKEQEPADTSILSEGFEDSLVASPSSLVMDITSPNTPEDRDVLSDAWKETVVSESITTRVERMVDASSSSVSKTEAQVVVVEKPDARKSPPPERVNASVAAPIFPNRATSSLLKAAVLNQKPALSIQPPETPAEKSPVPCNEESSDDDAVTPSFPNVPGGVDTPGTVVLPEHSKKAVLESPEAVSLPLTPLQFTPNRTQLSHGSFRYLQKKFGLRGPRTYTAVERPDPKLPTMPEPMSFSPEPEEEEEEELEVQVDTRVQNMSRTPVIGPDGYSPVVVTPTMGSTDHTPPLLRVPNALDVGRLRPGTVAYASLSMQNHSESDSTQVKMLFPTVISLLTLNVISVTVKDGPLPFSQAAQSGVSSGTQVVFCIPSSSTIIVDFFIRVKESTSPSSTCINTIIWLLQEVGRRERFLSSVLQLGGGNVRQTPVSFNAIVELGRPSSAVVEPSPVVVPVEKAELPPAVEEPPPTLRPESHVKASLLLSTREGMKVISGNLKFGDIPYGTTVQKELSIVLRRPNDNEAVGVSVLPGSSRQEGKILEPTTAWSFAAMDGVGKQAGVSVSSVVSSFPTEESTHRWGRALNIVWEAGAGVEIALSFILRFTGMAYGLQDVENGFKDCSMTVCAVEQGGGRVASPIKVNARQTLGRLQVGVRETYFDGLQFAGAGKELALVSRAGQQVSRAVKFRNVGAAPLSLVFRLAGEAARFSFSPERLSLEPGQTKDVVIEFSPSPSLQKEAASLQITIEGLIASLSIRLAGNVEERIGQRSVLAAVCPITTDRPVIAFGSVSHSDVETRSHTTISQLRIKNTSSSVVRIDAMMETEKCFPSSSSEDAVFGFLNSSSEIMSMDTTRFSFTMEGGADKKLRFGFNPLVHGSVPRAFTGAVLLKVNGFAEDSGAPIQKLYRIPMLGWSGASLVELHKINCSTGVAADELDAAESLCSTVLRVHKPGADAELVVRNCGSRSAFIHVLCCQDSGQHRGSGPLGRLMGMFGQTHGRHIPVTVTPRSLLLEPRASKTVSIETLKTGGSPMSVFLLSGDELHRRRAVAVTSVASSHKGMDSVSTGVSSLLKDPQRLALLKMLVELKLQDDSPTVPSQDATEKLARESVCSSVHNFDFFWSAELLVGAVRLMEIKVVPTSAVPFSAVKDEPGNPFNLPVVVAQEELRAVPQTSDARGSMRDEQWSVRPNEVAVGRDVRTSTFLVTNPSASALIFRTHLRPINCSASEVAKAVSVRPSKGVIPAHDDLRLIVQYQGDAVGLECAVDVLTNSHPSSAPVLVSVNAPMKSDHGLYFRPKRLMLDDAVRVGETVSVRVKLCNSLSRAVTVHVAAPVPMDAGFRSFHESVTLQSSSFVWLPLEFCPSSAGKKKAMLCVWELPLPTSRGESSVFAAEGSAEVEIEAVAR